MQFCADCLWPEGKARVYGLVRVRGGCLHLCIYGKEMIPVWPLGGNSYLLYVTSYLCSVSKPNKLTDSLGLNFDAVFSEFVLGTLDIVYISLRKGVLVTTVGQWSCSL